MKILFAIWIWLLNTGVNGQWQTQKFDAFPLFTFGDASNAKYIQCNVPELADSQSFVIDVTTLSSSQSIQDCVVRNISVYIQHGAQPLLINGGFPPDTEFYTKRTNLMNLTMSNLDGQVAVNFDRPLAGYWYVAAFLEPQIVSDDSIKQRGLGSKKNCGYLFNLQHFVLPSAVTTFDFPLNRAPVRYLLSATGAIVHVHTDDTHYETVASNKVIFRVGPTADERLTVYAFEILVDRCFVPATNTSREIQTCPLVVTANSGALPASSSPYVNCSSSSGTENSTFSSTATELCKLRFDLSSMRRTTFISLSTWTVWPVLFDLQIRTLECAEASSGVDHSTNPTTSFTTSTNTPKATSDASNANANANSNHTTDQYSTAKPSTASFSTAVTNSLKPIDAPFCTVTQRLAKFYSLTQRFNYVFFDSGFALAPGSAAFSVPVMVSERNINVVPFSIDRLVDQGGTLNFEFKLIINTNICVEKRNSTLEMHQVVSNCSDWRVDICVSREVLPITSSDTVPWRCDAHRDLVTNVTYSRNEAQIYYPYPEAGLYFLAFRLVHDSNDTSWVVLPKLIRFDISSAPCLDGSCNGPMGDCARTESFQNLRFAFCDCKYGYTGFACTNASLARSSSQQKLEMTLLMISNIAFLPAIILTAYNRFWMEAAVYAYTMVASTIYHACDSGTLFSFCVLPQASLSILDFFGSLSSLMVTTLCIADLPHANTKSLILTCSLLVALVAITVDRFSIWSFLVPIAICCVVLVISWSRHCYTGRQCHPPKRDWLTRLLPGFVLLVAALCMFGLLETESNYYLVHSAWHVLAALACVAVLPRHALSKGKSLSLISVNTEIVMNSRRPSDGCENGNANRRSGRDQHVVLQNAQQLQNDERDVLVNEQYDESHIQSQMLHVDAEDEPNDLENGTLLLPTAFNIDASDSNMASQRRPTPPAADAASNISDSWLR